jgi:hypothetical protein
VGQFLVAIDKLTFLALMKTARSIQEVALLQVCWTDAAWAYPWMGWQMAWLRVVALGHTTDQWHATIQYFLSLGLTAAQWRDVARGQYPEGFQVLKEGRLVRWLENPVEKNLPPTHNGKPPKNLPALAKRVLENSYKAPPAKPVLRLIQGGRVG